MTVRVLHGDCRDMLRTLPDQSVHCVVTSPPYYKLRDYGVNGQMGLEDTPEQFIAGMVEVFREVRRVLRDDGTLFLNIGDSYMASGATFRGGFQRAAARGNGDKELEGSQVRGCLCESLCDACRKAYRIGKSHSNNLPAPTLAASTHASSHEHTELQIGHFPTSGCLRQAARTEGAIPDPAQDGCPEYGPPHGVLASTTLRCDAPHLVSCLEASSRGGECQLCGATFLRCALPSLDSSACTCGIELRSAPSARGTSGMIFSDSAYVGLTTKFHIKPKDLIGIPWMLAFALRADGWYLRSEIIWCLSGGTRVYAKTQKGEMPMSIKDMVRLDPATVQLWNGEKWTQVLGWNETARPDVTYEIELRNGQRIGCTGNHEWPTARGNVRADQLRAVGGMFPADVIQTCRLPEPSSSRHPSALDDEMVGWFVGLYIAEGSQSDGTIQIASHMKEGVRFARLRQIAEAFDGHAAIHKTSENGCTVSINSPVLLGIIDAYVSGRIASDKHLHPRCWQRSDRFLRAVLDGYLSGDGHWDEGNNRWRLGFCANDELVADLRTVGARLGITVRLKRVVHKMGAAEFPGYKGEVRFARSDHHNNRPDGEVVAIRESRARKFWHIGVADEPHLFALASGVLTHNSKPNPMPESVTDRPTKAHEQIFLLTKSPRYYYDAEAIKEAGTVAAGTKGAKGSAHRAATPGVNSRPPEYKIYDGTRNARSVWTIATKPYPEAHFATFPPDLPERCIKAGTSERGCCAVCGAPWVRLVEKNLVPTAKAAKRNVVDQRDYAADTKDQDANRQKDGHVPGLARQDITLGWEPSCQCNAATIPCTILDPFGGAGTTGLVADRLQRDAILIELNPDYAEMARRRIAGDAGLFGVA